MTKRVVLAYSGGLDTSVAIRWMIEEWGVEVVGVLVNVGQDVDSSESFDDIRDRALAAGAVDFVLVDARREMAEEFCAKAIFANARYENKYPLVSALSRPVIVRHLVQQARRFNAQAVAHGCTGKGNDQVRFEVGTHALAPDLEVLAPARNWGMTRADSVDYAMKWDIPIKATKEKIYSIDENLWGRAIECGAIEDPWDAPPEEPYTLTRVTQNEPVELTVSFREGVPVALDGVDMPLADLIQILNARAGATGFGRLDMVENRRVGIKSREVYECPAALALITAHADLDHGTRGSRRPRARARRRPRKGSSRDQMVRAGLRRHVVLTAQRGARRLHCRHPASRHWRRSPALRGARTFARGRSS
jgi:argininosuccinate synthase